MIGDAVERTVAIVGDDAGTRDSAATLLGAHGFQVHEFEPAAAIQADPGVFARACCLVLDLGEPGPGLITQLERLAVSGLPPTILIVNQVTAPLVARVRAFGVRMVLDRPVPPLELVAHVRALVGMIPASP